MKGLVYRDSLAVAKTEHELMIAWERDNARAEFLVCFHVYFIGLVCFSDVYNSLMIILFTFIDLPRVPGVLLPPSLEDWLR